MTADAAVTPGTAAERALVSDRLDRIEDRLESVDSHLARLVELQERRDQRDAAVHGVELQERALELQERSARGAWLRSLVSKELLVRLAFLLGGGGVGGWLVRGLLVTSEPEVAPPDQSSTTSVSASKETP